MSIVWKLPFSFVIVSRGGTSAESCFARPFVDFGCCVGELMSFRGDFGELSLDIDFESSLLAQIITIKMLDSKGRHTIFFFSCRTTKAQVPSPLDIIVHIFFVFSFIKKKLFLLSGSGGLTPPPKKKNTHTHTFFVCLPWEGFTICIAYFIHYNPFPYLTIKGLHPTPLTSKEIKLTFGIRRKKYI